MLVFLVRCVAIALFLSFTVIFCLSKNTQNKKPQKKTTKVKPVPVEEYLAPDEPSEAEEFYLLKRVPIGQSRIPVERYLKARQEARNLRRYSTALGGYLSAANGSISAELDSLGNWMQLGPGNIGGRTRALVITPSNPNLMYAGGVAGGVWKSTNAGSSWIAIGDILPNLAISSLVVDPSNPNIVYAGTGEGYFNNDAQRGAGIFKTTDGGTTWGQIASPNDDPGFYYVHKLVISPNSNTRIYAGTGTGVWRSNDGGMHWSPSFVTSRLRGCLDLAIRSDTATDYLIASMGTFAHALVMFNPDAAGGGFWTPGAFPDAFGLGRTSIAIAPSNQNIVYALASEYFNALVDPQPPGPFQHGLHAVFRSTDGGANWSARVRNTSPVKLNTLLLSNPIFASLVECGQGTSNALLSQGWYDNVIAVDPVDSNRVWAGGIDLFRSDDGGANWGLASYWWASQPDPHYAHADQHAIVFHPQYNGGGNRMMFVANDGGIFRTDNARASVAVGSTAACSPSNTAVTWTALNNGYGVTQFYHGLPYPDNSAYLGGTQDNGTIRGSDAQGPNSWSRILGGDGGSVAIDRNNTSVLYAQNTGLSIKKSTDGGVTFNSAINGISESPNNFLFISSFSMDPSNSGRLWTGGRQLWRTTNGAANWIQATDGQYTTAPYSSIAISPSDPNYVAGGSSDGYIISTRIGLSVDSTQHFAWTQKVIRQAYVSSVSYDPVHPDILYATYSTFKTFSTDNHVYRSTDAGSSWRGIDGLASARLPDVPVHSIVVDPSATAHLYVGTDLGVFVSLDWGQTWARENSGFSDVITESLAINSYAGTTALYGFTHGRGAWRVRVPPPCVNISPAGNSHTALAGSGTINVSAQTGCNWTAVTNDSWITITSGSSGTGNGIVAYTVTGNISGSQPIPRTGTIFIGEQVFLVKQTGNNCVVSIVPRSQYLGAGSGSASATGNSAGECLLTAVSHSSWITITSPPTGTNGFLQINYNYTANPLSTIRTGRISVSGPYSTEDLFIRQAGQGCSYSVNPQSITADGTVTTTGSIQVTATAGCAWTAVTSDSWISITSGSSGTGNGVVNYTLMRNNTPSFLGGHIIVAGYDIFVSQGPSTCVDFAASPTVLSFNQSGGQGIINVTTASYCQWTTDVDTSWVMITSPRPTVGSGYVQFTVMPNTTGMPRTATISLPFNTATVNQDGNSCFLTVSPLNSFFPILGGNGTLFVTVPTGCSWNAISGSPWIAINTGASGTGNGVISYSVTANLSNVERVGELNIEGVRFSVTQSGCAFSISPNGISVDASATSRTINITAPAGCSWNSQTSDTWITITTGQSGSGNGMVEYTLAANNGLTRTGSISLAGQIFTVNQAGRATSVGIDTIGLYSPMASAFFLRNSNSTGVADLSFSYGPGGAGLLPLAGDWDADGVDTIGLYNPTTSAFFLRNSSSTGVADLSFTYGPPGAGWIPLVGDWDGDGVDTIGLYNATTGTFFLRNSNSTGVADESFAYGPAGAGWLPIIGDWNGDGVDTIGLYNPTASTFFLRNSNATGVADVSFAYGPAGAGWKPVVGDWNGDGVDTIGLDNQMTSVFFLRNMNSTGVADLSFAYGPAGAGWPPLVGDWDGL